jgi:organic radical activating enzyme
MANMAPPTKTLGVTILHKCNFNCPHCGYLYVDESEDHDLKPGYRMTWDQIQRLIADCNSIRDEIFSFVINGGEPTLWEEGDLKFIDILLRVAAGNIYPTYNTNGSYFVDYGQCYEFFNRYSEESDISLMTFISIDKFHNNYDRKRGRAESLDNIVKVFDEMPAEKKDKHRVHVVSIVSKDPNSFLSAEMKEYYGDKGISFADFPMQPIGRAKNLMDEMPDSEEFFKNMPPPPKDNNLSYPIGTIIGEYYLHKGKKTTRLGNLKELVAMAIGD